MRVELVPGDNALADAVVELALATAGLEAGPVAPHAGSAWRAAALVDGVELRVADTAGDVSYAFSPRSTRGAMRA